MNMQQMMMQAQKMQREMQKAQEALAKKEFIVSKAGAVTITMLGSHQLQKIEIDPSILNPDDKDMVEEMITMAINEAIAQIDEENEAINSKISSKMPGF